MNQLLIKDYYNMFYSQMIYLFIYFEDNMNCVGFHSFRKLITFDVCVFTYLVYFF